jgi:hypothetical protein
MNAIIIANDNLPDRDQIINYLNKRAGWIKQKQIAIRRYIGQIGGKNAQDAKDILDESIDLFEDLHYSFISLLTVEGFL